MEQEKINKPKRQNLKVSAIQMCSKIGDKQANFKKVRDLISRDINENIDLIVLPEVWTVGWAPEYFRNSIDKDNETIEFLSKIAKEYNCWIVGGSYIEKDSKNYYNTCPVINRSGNLVAKYSKNHLFSYYGCNEGKYVTTGDNPVLISIDGIKTGLTICYDIRFPEIYRAYRKAGADLFINCAAWGLNKPIPWEVLTRCRAVENQTFMIALTQCGQINQNEWNIGHSRIIDYKGESIIEITNQKEGAMSTIIKFDDMYDFREKCTVLNDIKESYEVKIV